MGVLDHPVLDQWAALDAGLTRSQINAAFAEIDHLMGGSSGGAGPPGPAGPAGPQGPQGATGPQGPIGLTGATGNTGAAGPQGPAGAASTVPGPQGPQGNQGVQGLPGPTGPAGAQGQQGTTGAQGPPGPTAVSANAGNIATLGSDSLIFVPAGYGDNRLINGDMRIDQRGVASGAGGTAIGVYTVDRWVYGATQAAHGSWQRGNNSPQPSAGFPYSLAFTSGGFTPAATDQFIFYQPIEADQISDFQFGTPNAQPITLSFWAYSTLTGTFSGSLQNYAQTRSYPFSYSILTANTWTKVSITIPGDIAGTWVASGNAGAAFLVFDLGAGATRRGPAGAWASANYGGVTGSVSVIVTNGAQFLLTGVKLEIGSVATPFNRQSLAKSLADCQRYYETGEHSQNQGYYTGAATGWQGDSVPFKAVKRASATVSLSNGSYVNAGNLAAAAMTAYNFVPVFDIVAAGLFRAAFTFTADAEL